MWQTKQRYEIHNTSLATALPIHIHTCQVGNSKKELMSFGVAEVEKKVNSMPWMQSLNYTLLNKARDNHRSCTVL